MCFVFDPPGQVRNFLVFQGDVEATAQRQGKELYRSVESTRVTGRVGWAAAGPHCVFRADLGIRSISTGWKMLLTEIA